MSRFQLVEQFVRDASRADDLTRFQHLLDAVGAELGFDHFLLVHHVDFTCPPKGSVQVGNYPAQFLAAFIEHRHHVGNPVQAGCQQTAAGFTWDDLPRMISLTSRQKHILETNRRNGIGNGFVVPNHVPGEPVGSCSFSVRTGRDLPARSIPIAQLIGNFAFETARRLTHRAGRGGEQRRPVLLTSRQLDCLVLAAQGKSDSIIAQLLGLKPRTVNEYIETAKCRFGVSTRQQLIVRALFEGQISYSDILE